MAEPRYLVTGGAGFIGSSIARALLAEGAAVRVLDNFSTGHRANLEGLEVELVEGDLCDEVAARQACRGIEVVFHEAAIPSVPRSVRDPWESHTNNLDATVRLLIAARDAGVRRVVYAASASAYGEAPAQPKVETMPAEPLSPYAVAKVGGELYLRAFTRLYGLETIALRYFNIFGPRQDPTSPYSGVISRFIAAMAQGDPGVIFGDGFQTRDFTFVDNVVQANLLARARGVPGEVYNVGTGQRSSLLNVHAVLAHAFGMGAAPRFEPTREGDVRDSLADIAKARRDLGYTPAVLLEEGLQKTVAWWQSTHAASPTTR